MSIIITAAICFLVIGIVSYFVSIYNGLVIVSKNIDKAWANIDVLLKQRHDEIPKLVAVAQGYMSYEKDMLTSLTSMRTACMQVNSVGASSQAESGLDEGLKSVFAVSEKYPDLKADQNFMQLQGRISFLESQISDRRVFYNESVNIYNVRICQFPDMMAAGMLGLQPRDLFKVNAGSM